jgi:hypothetical protein
MKRWLVGGLLLALIVPQLTAMFPSPARAPAADHTDPYATPAAARHRAAQVGSWRSMVLR